MAKRPETVQEARARGYCIVSRAFRIASRLDSHDWKEKLAATHTNGMEWVTRLGLRSAADQYRRCVGKDNITVPASWIPKLGNSSEGPTEYLP